MSLNVEIDPDLRLESSVLVAVLAHWRALCDGRPMPAKADIDPLRISPGIWPYLQLIDIYNDPDLRLRWRLIGTHITEAVDRDSTGAYFDELYGPADYDSLALPLKWVIKAGQPMRFHGSSVFVGKDWNHYEGIYMPLSADGETVDTIFGGVHYATVETNR
jgi:hypothetical protein